MLWTRTIGVLPMASRIVSQIFPAGQVRHFSTVHQLSVISCR